jgi:uncharacterized protein YndB with AHSA1/START domain
MNDIRRSVAIDAPIDDVWAYLTQSDKLAQWLMPNTIEPRLGHVFTMDCPPGIGSGAPVECVVKEIAPPANGRARLVYSWTIDQPFVETLLAVDLRAENGGTRLDLVHSGWGALGPDDAYVRDRHEQGWDMLLGTALPAAINADVAKG